MPCPFLLVKPSQVNGLDICRPYLRTLPYNVVRHTSKCSVWAHPRTCPDRQATRILNQPPHLSHVQSCSPSSPTYLIRCPRPSSTPYVVDHDHAISTTLTPISTISILLTTQHRLRPLGQSTALKHATQRLVAETWVVSTMLQPSPTSVSGRPILHTPYTLFTLWPWIHTSATSSRCCQPRPTSTSGHQLPRSRTRPTGSLSASYPSMEHSDVAMTPRFRSMYCP